MPSNWPRRVAVLSAWISTACLGWLLLLQIRMVFSPAPQEMREGAAIWLTRLLLEGRNPYSLTELPQSTNVYGILYHLVVYPAARLFGNGFAVHRMVSLVSILGAAALMFRLLRRLDVDPLFAWIGTLLFYASSVYFIAPLARPDGLGIFLCMLSITCLLQERVTPTLFMLGLVCALLALATKIYLAYPPFILATYHVLFGPRLRGLLWGGVSVSLSVGLLFGLSRLFPAYINESLITNAQGGYTDVHHLLRQTRDWLVFSLPITVGLLVLVGAAVRARRLARPTPLAFATMANAGVFFWWLGWHPGAHMTYLFHLVTPVLIPAIWPRLGKDAWPRALVAASLPLACVLNAGYFPLTFSRFSESEATFARVNAIVLEHQRVLGSTEIAGLLAVDGRPVVDSGQSEYFNVAGFGDAIPGLIAWNLLEERWERFVTGMDSEISAGRYDLIVRSRRNGLIPADLLEERYRQIETFEIDFAWSGQHWPIDAWEPKPVLGAGF